MNSEPVAVDKIVLEGTMNYKDTPVLHYKIEYPRFRHPEYQDQLNKINEWYRRRVAGLQRKYETELYKEAVELYENSIESQFPFHMYEADSAFEVPYNDNGLLSLYFDDYIFTGGAHGSTVRHSDTWDVKDGRRLPLYRFTSDPAAFRAKILNEINNQIEAQIKSGEGNYFENYSQLVEEHFDPENYYLTPEGIVIYFQQYDIAPYSSGMPEFVIRQ